MAHSRQITQLTDLEKINQQARTTRDLTPLRVVALPLIWVEIQIFYKKFDQLRIGHNFRAGSKKRLETLLYTGAFDVASIAGDPHHNRAACRYAAEHKDRYHRKGDNESTQRGEPA
jgi:hypothetical protein